MEVGEKSKHTQGHDGICTTLWESYEGLLVYLQYVGIFHRFKWGKQHTPMFTKWRHLLLNFKLRLDLVYETNYTSNIQKLWQKMKPYSQRQTFSHSFSILFYTAGEPQAKTVKTSTKYIQFLTGNLFTIKHNLSTHNDSSAPTGRKAPQCQQVIHLKLLVLVSINPRGFEVWKNTPRAISRHRGPPWGGAC